MHLTKEEEGILDGGEGYAAQKSMQILAALGDIFGAEKLIPVKSVQVSGVSYHNLGDAGLDYLSKLAEDGRVKVPTFLNPAGMDLKAWKKLGISEEFAKKQKMVVDAFASMGVNTTCTCTPYLIGIVPEFGDHVAWAESSAVAYCNSVIGARTNREGGPSALAAGFIGKTPDYGLHIKENRAPDLLVKVETELQELSDWGALGRAIGIRAKNKIPLIDGPGPAPADYLKSFGASIVTFGSKPIYHIRGVTPEAGDFEEPSDSVTIGEPEMKEAYDFLNDEDKTIDFVSLGCPHASLDEIRQVAELLEGRRVADGVEMWVACARPIKEKAEELGYVRTIEDSGAKVAADTCMVVAPVKGRFKSVATTSAKGCYYSQGHNKMKTHIGPIGKCVEAAIEGEWKS